MWNYEIREGGDGGTPPSSSWNSWEEYDSSAYGSRDECERRRCLECSSSGCACPNMDVWPLPTAMYALRDATYWKYCADEGDKIICNRDKIGPWEEFIIEKDETLPFHGNYYIRGKEASPGVRFFCSDRQDRVKCNKIGVGYDQRGRSWERFTIEKTEIGTLTAFALKGGRDHKYCTAGGAYNNADAVPITCHETDYGLDNIGHSQKFLLEPI